MKIRRAITILTVAVSTVLGVGLTAAPAQAGTTYVYPVYHYQVCQRQGHFGASFYNYWNPRSWYCYDLSVPFGVTWAGGLDINGYCMSKYNGARAELWANNVTGWRCVKRV